MDSPNLPYTAACCKPKSELLDVLQLAIERTIPAMRGPIRPSDRWASRLLDKIAAARGAA